MLVLRAAIRWAARRPAPNEIPRSGPRTRGIDCYLVYVKAEDESWTLIADSASVNGIVGRLLGDEYPVSCSVQWKWLGGAGFQFVHFIGPYEFSSSSAWRFLANELTGFPRFWIYRDRVEQFFFNRKRLARTDRISALRFLIERSLEKENFEISGPGFLAAIHSNRSFLRPDVDYQLRYCGLLLSSLAKSGELSRNNAGRYSVNPQALTSLAAFENEERMHRDNVGQQAALKWLTFGLLILGAIQLIVAYLEG